VAVGGRLGLSDHEMIEFLVHGEVQGGPAKSPRWTFGGQTGLFRTLVERIPCERVLKGKEVHRGWTFFKQEVFKGTGAGCPHVPQDKMAGKTNGLAEQ